MTDRHLTYYSKQELNSWVVDDWKDENGSVWNLSSGWTFSLALMRATAPATTLLLKTTGITATSTAVTVAWAVDEFNGLENSLNGTQYVIALSATRTSDSRTLYYHSEKLPTLTLKTSPGDSAVSPSSYPITVTAASVTLVDAGGYYTATDVEGALREGRAATLVAASRPVTTIGATVAPYGNQTQLTIPTYDGSNVVVHPSVVHFERGWNGYRYWMAMTPYPASNSAFENPSILASNDGTTWVVPAGLTNPVEPQPASGFNSDPYLVFANDGYLYMFWRVVTSASAIWYRRSLDGITWTDKTLIMSTTAATQDIVSPCFIQEPDGTWRMYGVDIVPSPNTVVTRTGATLTGTWAASSTVSGVTVSTGRDPWHLDVHRIGGEYVLLINDAPLNGSFSGALYRAVSTDGTTFTTDAITFPAKRSTGNLGEGSYRCCFLPAEVGGGLGYEVYWCTTSTMSRGFVRVSADYRWQDDIGRMAAACANVAPYTTGDSVNRVDSAVAPGTATSGAAWTAQTATSGVSSKALYAVASVNTRATLPAGISDGEFGCTVKTAPGGSLEAYLIFRFSATNNYWRFGLASSGLAIQSVEAGAIVTNTGPLNMPYAAFKDGDRLKVICSGNTITAYVNDVQMSTVTSAFNNTATIYGFQTTSTATRFTNFYSKS